MLWAKDSRERKKRVDSDKTRANLAAIARSWRVTVEGNAGELLGGKRMEALAVRGKAVNSVLHTMGSICRLVGRCGCG